MNQWRYFWGLLLIIVGSLFFINYLFPRLIFTADTAWPFFLLIPGLVFELNYFLTSKNIWSLIPGGILTTLGLIFFFNAFTHWQYAAYSWPLFLLAPIIGLLQFYYFGDKNKKLLVPIFILTAIAAVSIMISLLALTSLNSISILIAAIFIIGGIFVLLKK
jgi:uncharacterized membrane protein HdeD (DUF308 family)